MAATADAETDGYHGGLELDPTAPPMVKAEGSSRAELAGGLGELAKQLYFRRHHDGRYGRLQAWFWSLAMVVAAVKHADFFVEFTQVQAGSQTSIQKRLYSKFWRGRRRMLLVILKTALAVTVQNFAAGKLKILWRKVCTAGALRSYLDENNTFYQLKLDGTVDYPDHRITSDVQTLVDYIVELASKLPEHAVKFTGLTRLMWLTSPATCLMLWSYALAGTYATRRGFEERLTGRELATQKLEAQLRYTLVRVGECAEGIAFHHAGPAERRQLLGTFDRLMAAQQGLLLWTGAFQAFQEVYNRVGTMLPSLITAPLFWQRQIEFGAISQMFTAFRSVKEILLFLATNYDKLASVAARLERLEALRRFPARWLQLHARSSHKIQTELLESSAGLHLVLRRLRVALPHSSEESALRWLERPEGISLELQRGGSLLIRGESGVGKSSVLRTIAGLWDEGDGQILRPPCVIFLPQTPYLPAGERGTSTTLREQLLYPDTRVSDVTLRSALEDVELGHLACRLDEPTDWALALSGGEKQRVVFARLLVQLHNADAPLVLLDEATSACSEPMEARLYGALGRSLEKSGGALVSVGHRSSLRQFHQHELVMEG